MLGNYWNTANKRKFFDDIARVMRFDPLDASSWYFISSDAVMQFKVPRRHKLNTYLRNNQGAVSVLSYYKGSIVSALLHLYPEIGLKKSEFTAIQPRMKIVLYLSFINI